MGRLRGATTTRAPDGKTGTRVEVWWWDGQELVRWRCSGCGKWAYHTEDEARQEAFRQFKAELKPARVYECEFKTSPPRFHLTSMTTYKSRPERRPSER